MIKFDKEQVLLLHQYIAAETGGTVEFITDPDTALHNADVVYTDIWVSMGEPIEAWDTRVDELLPYQVNAAAMAKASERAVFMHCLPSFHDLGTEIGRAMGARFGLDAFEVTNDVFEGPQSLVFREAENRMHTIKAVIKALLDQNCCV